MEQEKENKKKRASTATIRKPFEKGKRTQKMMTFRLDSDLEHMLTQETNKGRLINDLLREHFTKLGK